MMGNFAQLTHPLVDSVDLILQLVNETQSIALTVSNALTYRPSAPLRTEDYLAALPLSLQLCSGELHRQRIIQSEQLRGHKPHERERRLRNGSW